MNKSNKVFKSLSDHHFSCCLNSINSPSSQQNLTTNQVLKLCTFPHCTSNLLSRWQKHFCLLQQFLKQVTKILVLIREWENRQERRKLSRGWTRSSLAQLWKCPVKLHVGLLQAHAKPVCLQSSECWCPPRSFLHRLIFWSCPTINTLRLPRTTI